MNAFQLQFEQIVDYLKYDDFLILTKRIIDLTLDTESVEFYTKTNHLLDWLDVNVENQQITLTKEEIEIVNSSIEGWLVESDNGITVAIDTNLNEELIAEGNAREFINRIQNIRKDSNFDVTDRIMIKYNANEQLKFAINKFSDYISSETLADSITFVSDTELKDAVKESINGIDCLISISNSLLNKLRIG